MKVEENALRNFRNLVSEDLTRALETSSDIASRSCIYPPIATIWLMIMQRLNSDHSLAKAIEQFKRGSLDDILNYDIKRVSHRKISGATGGYCRARTRISLESVERAADVINQALESTHPESTRKEPQVYAIDGSTLRIAHTEKNCAVYPPNSNQKGQAHFPLVRFSVATNVRTGVAGRVVYGSYSGNKATDELSLAEKILPTLPKNSIVIGDRYYGCPRFAVTTKDAGCECICRLKEANTKKYIGSPRKKSGEENITWKSTFSRKKGNTDYSIQGRLIWHTLQRKGFKPIKLFLFTTLDLPIKKIVELYGLRWNVELDLRDIKSTLGMKMLNVKTPDMAHKELVLGMVAYNLIRHLMIGIARNIKVSPRELSFSRTLKRVDAIFFAVVYEYEPKPPQSLLFSLFCEANSLKLPKRKKRRPTEPRKVYSKGRVPLMVQSRETERQIIQQKQRIKP